ncbi:MAG: glutamine synthetase III [Lachnospiraceae bacterium]|nr:glutamine synthetase III [Lachnospiraceae bacterium]
MEQINVPEIYGSMVFNDKVMKERLPKDVYKAVRKTIDNGTTLELTVANTVAATMKEWAIERGATHFTHWFQPMTGLTAEKHDSFINPDEKGNIIMNFSGKELVKGEPDASSFPSGGIRATFEARGYTAWDPSSPAFVKDGSLYIPTAFCSYTGESLDKKTPLLRSMDALNHEAVHMLHFLGKPDVKHVDTTIGSEQEYFLIDKDMYLSRKDLVLTGRTLFGAPAPKGQEMEDHYFGVLKPRVSEFMHDLDQELWKLGVPAKTKHNEVAPAQHELAPVFEMSNIAVDHNQLTMEIMKKVADRHNMACLLHEKPFDGVNGSGKHVNWSMGTDTGENLLEPGTTPAENTQFLVFLVAVIAAVDKYADLMRASVATAGNDHRLGANEAPPAVVSIFVGDELAQILDAIEKGQTPEDAKHTLMDIGAKVLPTLTKDTTDRNRTSPFAFTGNKFEFRMPGSSVSVADPAIILNTAVADSLREIRKSLEGTPKDQLETAIMAHLQALLKEHHKILFNGNGYAEDWVEKAEARGLYNLKSVPDAMPAFIAEKNVALFEKFHIYNASEIQARYEINLENYAKAIHIESLTMQDMIKKDVRSALVSYSSDLADEALAKKELSKDIDTDMETELVDELAKDGSGITSGLKKLAKDTKTAEGETDSLKKARYYHDVILQDMADVRSYIDAAEAEIPSDYLNYPTYEEMMFSLR